MSTSLSRLPPPAVKLKSISSRNYIFYYNDTCMMTKFAAQHCGKEPTHVLRPKILHLYQNRDRETLWWRAHAHNLSMKKVVRTSTAKRVRKIFREVLFQQGYDPHGRPLAFEKLPKDIPVRYLPVAGTLDISILPGAVTQQPADMRGELELLFLRASKGMDRMRADREKKGQDVIGAISQILSLA